MITPKFDVTQDDNFVHVTIYVPHLRTQDIDLHAQDNQLRFFARPYFLRLAFPGAIVEDERSTANYDLGLGQLVLQLSKVNPGEHFPDLDLLSTLLATTKEQQVKAQPLIQVISDQTSSTEPPSDLAGEDFDWELPQALPSQENLTSTVEYGFNNQYRGWFTHVQEVGNEINSLSSPETLDEPSRQDERVEAEEDKFDPDYYISEWMENEEISDILAHKTPWRKCYQEIRRRVQSATSQPENVSPRPPAASATVQPVESIPTDTYKDRSSTSSSKVSLSVDNLPSFLSSFSDKEKALMQSLPTREYLMDPAVEKRLYLGLVDLMFVYNYNHRTTYGDSTIESVWTIGKLSPALSCLVLFPTLKELIVALYRRSLAYPLYRHWELCKKVQQDTFVLLSLGRRGVLKALLELKDLFDHHDVYYIYSKIWLDDYCRWIQTSANENVLQSLAQQVNRLSLTKADINLSLEEWETIALVENSESETDAEGSTDDDDDDSTESDGSESDSDNGTDSQEAPIATSATNVPERNEAAPELISSMTTDRPSSARQPLISIISDEPASASTSNIDSQEAEPPKERASTTITSSALLDEHVDKVTSSLKFIALEKTGSTPKQNI